MRPASASLLLFCLLGCTGCQFNRQSASALTQAQTKYFQSLHDALVDRREILKDALEGQAIKDARRRENIYLWQRDQLKADMLLQTRGDASGARRLLLLKLAQLDLDARAQLLAISAQDAEQVDRIMKVYDAVADAAEAAGKNNAVVTSYLSSSSFTFAVRSADLDAIARAVGVERDVRRKLDGLKPLSDDEKKARDVALTKKVSDVRDELIKILGAKP